MENKKKPYNRLAAHLSEEAADEAHRLSRAAEVPVDGPFGRDELEAKYGCVWDSFQLARDFEVEAYHESFVVVRRRSDGVRGTVVFQHDPRLHWGFKPD